MLDPSMKCSPLLGETADHDGDGANPILITKHPLRYAVTQKASALIDTIEKAYGPTNCCCCRNKNTRWSIYN